MRAFWVVLLLCVAGWFIYPQLFGSPKAEKPVACDAGGYFMLDQLRINIPAEYMQAVYAAAAQKPAQGGNTYTCADVSAEKPLPISHMRFFPEAFLNKNILIEDTPYKTITAMQVRPVPEKDSAPAAAFECNNLGQCAAVVIRNNALFMVEMSESYFGSNLQKDIFYASFQRFVESLLSAPQAPAAE